MGHEDIAAFPAFNYDAQLLAHSAIAYIAAVVTTQRKTLPVAAGV